MLLEVSYAFLFWEFQKNYMDIPAVLIICEKF